MQPWLLYENSSNIQIMSQTQQHRGTVVILCDPMWHVSSRSGVVLVAQTAIRFLTLPSYCRQRKDVITSVYKRSFTPYPRRGTARHSTARHAMYGAGFGVKVATCDAGRKRVARCRVRHEK